jgi:hypothetical protein
VLRILFPKNKTTGAQESSIQPFESMRLEISAMPLDSTRLDAWQVLCISPKTELGFSEFVTDVNFTEMSLVNSSSTRNDVSKIDGENETVYLPQMINVAEGRILSLDMVKLAKRAANALSERSQQDMERWAAQLVSDIVEADD